MRPRAQRKPQQAAKAARFKRTWHRRFPDRDQQDGKAEKEGERGERGGKGRPGYMGIVRHNRDVPGRKASCRSRVHTCRRHPMLARLVIPSYQVTPTVVFGMSNLQHHPGLYLILSGSNSCRANECMRSHNQWCLWSDPPPVPVKCPVFGRCSRI